MYLRKRVITAAGSGSIYHGGRLLRKRQKEPHHPVRLPLFTERILLMPFSSEFSYCKLEIFIPETHLRLLQQTLQEVDAGHIGKYDCCLSYSRVTGCFRPLAGCHPYLGTEGEISEEPELKVEVTCPTEKVGLTVKAVRKIHPYEEPVINVIPLYATGLAEKE